MNYFTVLCCKTYICEILKSSLLSFVFYFLGKYHSTFTINDILLSRYTATYIVGKSNATHSVNNLLFIRKTITYQLGKTIPTNSVNSRQNNLPSR